MKLLTKLVLVAPGLLVSPDSPEKGNGEQLSHLAGAARQTAVLEPGLSFTLLDIGKA